MLHTSNEYFSVYEEGELIPYSSPVCITFSLTLKSKTGQMKTFFRLIKLNSYKKVS